MHNNPFETSTNQSTSSATTVTSQNHDTSRLNNITINTRNTSHSMIVALVLIAGGVVLLILCATEFDKINSYLKTLCFVLSVVVAPNYTSGDNGRLMYQAVWNVIVTDSDGTNGTTSIRSPISESYPAFSIYSLASQYKVNSSYVCYRRHGNIDLARVHFDPPSKAKAIGFLVGCILLFILGITVFLLVEYFGWKRRQLITQQQHDAQLGLRTSGTTSETCQEQSPIPYSAVGPSNNTYPRSSTVATIEEEQERNGSLPSSLTAPPPTYEEAVEHIAPSSSMNFNNFFDRLGFRRQMSNATQL